MKRTLWLGLLILGALLAGCGGTTTTKATTPTATAPLPTATPTVDASKLAACGIGWSDASGVAHVGDLLVQTPRLAHLAYPSRKLPESTPLAPLRLAAQSGAALDAQIPPDPPTNPKMNPGPGGYGLRICNGSAAQSHVIKSVSVRLETLQSYSGQLSQWNDCDGSYSPAIGHGSGGGCGGGGCDNEILNAVFSAGAGVGTTVVAAQVASSPGLDCAGYGPLPVSLKPHQTISIDVGMTVPTTPGLYGFSFGLAQDSAAPTFLPADKPVLLVPNARVWGGKECETTSMRSQIPATPADAVYICPTA